MPASRPGLALGVVESAYVSVAGVAPIMIYLRGPREVVTISGLGTWPRAASCDYFQRASRRQIPKGILRTVVPAAPDAWITALERFGTMRFAEVAAAAIRFARDGFAMYPLMAETIAAHARTISRRWPPSARDLPARRRSRREVGELFVQAISRRTLQYMADEEAAAAATGRAAGLQAARDAFYRGDIAAAIVDIHRDNGGLLDARRPGGVPRRRRAGGARPLRRHRRLCLRRLVPGTDAAAAAHILDGIDLRGLGHNSAAYVHLLTEAIKLAAADREAYYGDPRFVDVPLERCCPRNTRAERRAMIDPSTPGPTCRRRAGDGLAQRRHAPRPHRRRRAVAARHQLCLRGRPARQRLLGHAERRHHRRRRSFPARACWSRRAAPVLDRSARIPHRSCRASARGLTPNPAIAIRATANS